MIDIKRKSVSTLIDRMIPSHIVEGYPTYVRFIQAYFEYVETQFNEYDMISNILGYGDVDNAALVPEFFTEYKKQYIGVLPGNLAADSVLLIKNIRSFYKAKGTEDSFRFLFRALYDKEIQFYYPSRDMLRVSDGKWTVPTYLVPTNQVRADLDLWVGQPYSNTDNTANGIFESLHNITDPNNAANVVTAFLISSNVGVFNQGDAVISTGTSLPNLVVDSYKEFPGYWNGEDGKLSSNKKIQDSYYYQDFSYELQTDLSVVQYTDLIKRVIHPAGMAMFGKFTVFDATRVQTQAVTNITLWLLEWEKTLDLSNTITPFPSLLYTVLQPVRDYWTYGLVEANRSNAIVTNRYPTIADFRVMAISDFSNADTPFNYFPSSTVNESINFAFVLNGVSKSYTVPVGAYTATASWLNVSPYAENTTAVPYLIDSNYTAGSTKVVTGTGTVLNIGEPLVVYAADGQHYYALHTAKAANKYTTIDVLVNIIN